MSITVLEPGLKFLVFMGKPKTQWFKQINPEPLTPQKNELWMRLKQHPTTYAATGLVKLPGQAPNSSTELIESKFIFTSGNI